MKKIIKEITIITIPFILLIGTMYIAKLFEIIFAKVPVPIMFLMFLIIIYKIIKEVIYE